MKQHRGLPAILTILFALAVCCFWGIIYPHHIHFQEQEQMFLFDVGYARSVMSVPGGVSDWLGRFLTQFFLFAWAGAAILAVMLGLMQWMLSRGSGWTWRYALSFVPSVLLWRVLLDDSALPGLVVAILLCLPAAWGIVRLRHHGVRNVAALVGLPLMYWVSGPIALWLYTGVVAVGLLRRARTAWTWATLAALVLTGLALPAVVRQWVTVDMPMLVGGVHYYRTVEHDPMLMWLAVAAMVLTEGVNAWGHRLEWQRLKPIAAVPVVWVLGAALVTAGVNPAAEEVMAYDFMARHQQWNRILQTAEAKAPNNPLCATVLNLALCMKGRMTEHMFDYPQRGTAGLLPEFDRDPVSPLATSEVFYQLGMINTAQRFTYEAQEALPDYQKSARCYRRLAETNLINGAYGVAAKYLRTLQKTLFYRQWATQTLALIADDASVARHSEYGRLRQCKIGEDFFYSDRDLLQMLGKLFLANPRNRLAFEYLEAACLLRGELDMFVQCFGLNTELNYNPIPTLYQQALLLWWSRDHAASERVPDGIRPDIVSNIRQFYLDIQSQSSHPERLEPRYGKTYWYYYFSDRKQ